MRLKLQCRAEGGTKWDTSAASFGTMFPTRHLRAALQQARGLEWWGVRYRVLDEDTGVTYYPKHTNTRRLG
jgi:hypothetical protein